MVLFATIVGEKKYQAPLGLSQAHSVVTFPTAALKAAGVRWSAVAQRFQPLERLLAAREKPAPLTVPKETGLIKSTYC